MTRSGPNAVSITSATGANSRRSAPGAASVISPESLQTVLGNAANSLIAAVQAVRSPLAMGGLPA